MRFGDNDTDIGNGTATIQRTFRLVGVSRSNGELLVRRE